MNLARRIAPVALLLLPVAGCGGVFARSFHDRFGWQAEDFFDDPQVIALCEAIEANDLEEIDRLVAAGADVNAKGKGNMTPLLWAYPDNKPERFKKLLELGADPNVIVESDFNRGRGIDDNHGRSSRPSRTSPTISSLESLGAARRN